MKRLCISLGIALSALIATPSAHALSCMQPDIERELKRAIESDKVYHILVGHFDAPQIPRKEVKGSDPFIMKDRSRTVGGYFSGYSMAKSRRADVPLERLPIQIRTSCAAHWCGQVPQREQKMIVFVEAQAGGPPLLTMGPCPYMSHNYSEDKIRLLRRGL